MSSEGLLLLFAVFATIYVYDEYFKGGNFSSNCTLRLLGALSRDEHAIPSALCDVDSAEYIYTNNIHWNGIIYADYLAFYLTSLWFAFIALWTRFCARWNWFKMIQGFSFPMLFSAFATKLFVYLFTNLILMSYSMLCSN